MSNTKPKGNKEALVYLKPRERNSEARTRMTRLRAQAKARTVVVVGILQSLEKMVCALLGQSFC